MTLTERALSANTAASSTSVTSLSVSPTGMAQNDWLVFLVVSVGGAATHSNTAGSCSRAHAADFTQGNTTVVSTWKKKAAVSEAGPYTFDIGATTRRVAVACRAYTDGDATDIIDVAQVFTGDSNLSLGITSVTPGGTDRWHLLFEGSNSAGGGSVTFTQPTNYTEKHDFASTHASSANACLGWAERVLTTTDATGVQTFSISDTVNRALAGGSILLKPASETPPAAATVDRRPRMVGQAVMRASIQ